MTIYRLPRRVPEKNSAQRLINDAGHIAGLAFEIGAFTSAEAADSQAALYESEALRWAEEAKGQQLDPMLALEQAGDRAWRARLLRARAKELRS